VSQRAWANDELPRVVARALEEDLEVDQVVERIRASLAARAALICASPRCDLATRDVLAEHLVGWPPR
jgi:hypothetical protein